MDRIAFFSFQIFHNKLNLNATLNKYERNKNY
jgi:hypothetical protein